MSFLEDVKRRMMAALKAGNVVEKEILRTAIGEMTMQEARGLMKSDDDAMAIVRKLLKSNEETLSLATDAAQRETLAAENTVLRSLLPQTLDVAAITAALEPVRDAVRAAKSDGQATGVAMKHLKSVGANVDGKDVTEAVKQLRAP